MGLFEKKFCDICGEKIGLLGNRKLDDGNLCKDCARKLSPFFSERRSSTVEQIRQQLLYREENRLQLSTFRPSITYGHGNKAYIDQSAGKFIITRSNDWKSANPDIISFSQVLSVNFDIKENRSEIKTKDAEGKQVSYNPPRYEYTYDFPMTITVDSPWFSEISLDLSEGDVVDNCNSLKYHNYERETNELAQLLTGRLNGMSAAEPQQFAQPQQNTAPAPAVSEKWTCPACQGENTGKFCEYCGTPRP